MSTPWVGLGKCLPALCQKDNMGKLYFFRGFAYESLGYYSNAKKDYKAAKKNGVHEATAALERIKQIRKAKK